MAQRKDATMNNYRDHRSGKKLLTEVFADPGRHDFYYREKMPDSVARYVRTDLCLTQADLDAAVKAEQAEIARLKSCISDMQKRVTSTRGDQAYRELPSYIVKACAAAIRKGTKPPPA
jgi:hypothetical protein